MNMGDYLYNLLPEVYRFEDAKPTINFVLKRYLESLASGGFQPLFEELLKLCDLWDIEKCPTEILPLIGKLLGYEYIEEIDAEVQRKILANISELYKRKGTKAVITFISREFSKFDTNIIDMEYRVFKTFEPKPLHPTGVNFVEPKTLGLNFMDEDTCCLYDEDGIYNPHTVVVNCDSQISSGTLLVNKLLKEFLSVYCKLILRIRKGDAIIEEVTSTIDETKPQTILHDKELIGDVQEDSYLYLKDVKPIMVKTPLKTKEVLKQNVKLPTDTDLGQFNGYEDVADKIHLEDAYMPVNMAKDEDKTKLSYAERKALKISEEDKINNPPSKI